MATVIVHEVDEQALSRLRDRAEAQGSSVEAELRIFIEQRGRIANSEQTARARQAVADMRAYREAVYAKYGPMPNSTNWLREDREGS